MTICLLRRFAGIAVLLVVGTQPALADSRVAPPPAAAGECDEIGLTKGDYLGDRRLLQKVEEYHFKPHHENLIQRAGDSTNELGANLSYTLRSFPNHHRALYSMMRLVEKTGQEHPKGADRPAECYFRRAVKFRPDDTVARMLYATYLKRRSRAEEATVQLDITAQHVKDNPFSTYNLGLMYAEVGRWDKALDYAHRAQALGFPKTALRERLQQAGKWQDAPGSGTANAASSPAVSAAEAAASAPN